MPWDGRSCGVVVHLPWGCGQACEGGPSHSPSLCKWVAIVMGPSWHGMMCQGMASKAKPASWASLGHRGAAACQPLYRHPQMVMPLLADVKAAGWNGDAFCRAHLGGSRAALVPFSLDVRKKCQGCKHVGGKLGWCHIGRGAPSLLLHPPSHERLPKGLGGHGKSGHEDGGLPSKDCQGGRAIGYHVLLVCGVPKVSRPPWG